MDKKSTPVNLGAKMSPVDPKDEPIASMVKAGTEVSIFLSSGIRLSGKIIAANSVHLILRHRSDQVVYKNHIATICTPDGTYFI